MSIIPKYTAVFVNNLPDRAEVYGQRKHDYKRVWQEIFCTAEPYLNCRLEENEEAGADIAREEVAENVKHLELFPKLVLAAVAVDDISDCGLNWVQESVKKNIQDALLKHKIVAVERDVFYSAKRRNDNVIRAAIDSIRNFMHQEILDVRNHVPLLDVLFGDGIFFFQKRIIPV